VRARLRSWQGGVVVAAACLVVGVVRVVTVPGLGADDGLAWASFALALSYGCAALALRPARGPARSARRVVGVGTVLTKDRVGATLAIAAAVVGLVLVFGDREHRESRDAARQDAPGQSWSGMPARSSGSPG